MLNTSFPLTCMSGLLDSEPVAVLDNKQKPGAESEMDCQSVRPNVAGLDVRPTTAALPMPRTVETANSGGSRWLDRAECLLVLMFYGWLSVRLAMHFATEGGLANLLLLPSEGLVVVFILIRRRSTVVSRSAIDWLLAMAVTSAPMLAHPGISESAWLPVQIAAIMMFSGLVLQLHAKLTLGRSLGCIPANRGLKLTGPYCFIRHPMYAGYLLGHAAFFAMNPTWWNLCVYAFSETLQIPRLLAEERLLSLDLAYQAYCGRVRYRLIPGVF